MSRHTALVAASALAATTLLASTAASASPTSEDATTGQTPPPEAEAAGIEKEGDAAMGWKERDPRTRSQAAAAAPSGVPGIDVSSWQGTVDWAGQYSAGKRFAYVKATEGTTYTSPSFGHQYNGSYNAGMIRGAYHFALPDSSSGATQANHFVDNGGGWSSDGKTLPGALDMEWNPYGATCFGKSQSQMRSWISDFLETYENRTGRYPAIYTNATWWNECVGSASFGDKSPLWVARYSDSVGSLPSGWSVYTFWQYTDTPIDQNVFNGSLDRLKVLAKG